MEPQAHSKSRIPLDQQITPGLSGIFDVLPVPVIDNIWDGVIVPLTVKEMEAFDLVYGLYPRIDRWHVTEYEFPDIFQYIWEARFGKKNGTEVPKDAYDGALRGLCVGYYKLTSAFCAQKQASWTYATATEFWNQNFDKKIQKARDIISGWYKDNAY